MLFSDLALILTIMINTLILHQSSEAVIIAGDGQPNLYPQQDLKHLNYLDVNEKSQRFPAKNGRANKAAKMRQRKWYLYPVMLTLAMAVEKYEEKNGLIDPIYKGVIGCGINRCEKFQGLIPENQSMRRVICFTNNFKKMIWNKLLEFQGGVRKIEETFGKLIYFEGKSGFCNRSRRTLLEDLKRDITMLSMEIKTAMTNQRFNSSLQPETLASSPIPHPDTETHLIINEWRIIQDSKRFLRDWQKNFDKMFRCWKKRRQKRIRRKKGFDSLNHPLRPTHPTRRKTLRNSRRKTNRETIFSRPIRREFSGKISLSNQ